MAGVFSGSDLYPPIPDPAPVGGYGPAYGAYGSDYGTGGDTGGYYGGNYVGGYDATTGLGGDYGGSSAASGGGILDWLASDKGQRALSKLSGFSSGLLQGSGPSLQPRNFYSALGTGVEGMQKAGSQYDTDALKRAQGQEAQAKVANLGVWDTTLQNEARNATGLPPGYVAPGAGTTGTSTPAVASGTSGGGGRGGWGPLAQPAIGALSAAGLSLAAQQAIMGHGIAEGGFNIPWNVGDSGNSFGHWQFNKRGELPGYMTWAQGKGDPQDTALQAQYVAKRMEEIYPGFSKITDPAKAMAMVADFERYKGYQTNKRLGFLADAQKAMGGGELEPRIRLSDTAFQVPSNMAAGLGGPGILPPAAPAPGGTQPPGLATGLRPPVAPVATLPSGAPVAAAPLITAAPPAAEPPPTTGTSAPAAARVAAAGAPSLAEGDSIAYGFSKFGGLPGNPKGGRNPEQVLQNIDGNLKRDPDYYRGKTVMLSSGVMNGPGRIDLVPEQIQRIQDAGGKVILAGVDTGQFAGHNGTLAQMAADAGVPFGGPLPTNKVHPGPDGYRQYLARVRRGAARVSDEDGGGGGPGGAEIAPVPVNPEPLASGAVPGAVLGTVTRPVPVPPVTQPPAAPGSLAPGGALQLPPVAPAATGPAATGAVLVPGTAPGMPVPAAPPPSVPPAPPPGVAVAPPGGPPPPPAPGAAVGGPPGAMPGAIAGATAGARPTVPMPAVITAQPLPPPNLPQPGSAGVPGLPPYDVAAARRAQIISLAGAATGHQVPAYLADQANLPNKAIAQQWEMQKTLYGAQLTAVSDQWKAANDMQKEAIAAQNGLTKAGYESTLRTQENEWDKGRMIGPDGRVMLRPGFAEAEGAKAGATKAGELGAQLPYDIAKDYNTIREVKGVVQSGPNAGAPTTRYVSQAQIDAEAGRPPPAAVVAAMGGPPPAAVAPPPGGTQAPGTGPAMPAAIPAPETPTGLPPTQTARIEGDKAQWQTVASQHTQANVLRPYLDQVIEMANKTPSGWSVPVNRVIAQTLSGFGLPVNESMSNAEVMKSISQALIPTVRQPGAQSNVEMVNYLSTVPGLAQSPAGRIQIAMMNKAMIDRLGDIAETRRANLGAADLDEKLKALDTKPLFTPVQKATMVAAQSSKGRPIDAKSYELLPSGMPFYDADGRHIKP